MQSLTQFVAFANWFCFSHEVQKMWSKTFFLKLLSTRVRKNNNDLSDPGEKNGKGRISEQDNFW